ncbi:MAG: MSHA biogenesis protein MshJ [Gammaproteobacteria bacterium]|jgi:MSHA biogenesis protein MshJ
MASHIKHYVESFNGKTIRERGLVLLVLIGLTGFAWGNYFAEPRLLELDAKQSEILSNSNKVDASRLAIAAIHLRINSGVHRGKERQLEKLKLELNSVEQELQVKAKEMIDPERMFRLMTQLIYKESQLTLKSLKRLEVKPAIPLAEGQSKENQVGIFRHVLEIELDGKYADIVAYMQALENLEWKLFWDQVEVVSNDYPLTRLKLVISTLSTRKEWVGI